MYWNEEKATERYQISDAVVDLTFAIKCKCLPVEHMNALSAALQQEISWLEAEKFAGIHPIYGAESGNGWERPTDPNELIYFSKRQKMTIRLPKERIDDAEKLVGQVLTIAGQELEVGKSTVKLLSDLPTIFCRQVMTEQSMTEDEFLEWSFQQLKLLDIPVNKMMPGKERVVSLATGDERVTRSLMVADLDKSESVRLQQHGLGEGRQLGCGLFVPQKGIKAVNSDD